MSKFYIETYGCAANKSDSEIMISILKSKGFILVNSPKDSDINIINTCIVKTPTANRMVYRIKELYKTGKPLVVAGCMAKAESERVEKIAPNASLIGPNSIGKIYEVVSSALYGKKVKTFGDFCEKPSLPHVFLNRIISIIQISQGCLSNCTYCETKLARGKLKSYSPRSIINRIREDLINGSKEFWLTSQDNGCYGFDIGTDLSELMKKISELEENFFVRIGMANPLHVKLIIGKLLKSLESDKFFKFFHIPVQSGSDKVLLDMKRGYRVDDFVNIVEKIRKKFENPTISTDIIVGYPTETEQDFKETLELIEYIKPDVLNISRFSRRPNTEAYNLKPIPEKIVKKRSKKLYELFKKISEENNKKWIGWKGEALIDEKTSQGFVSRNQSYKPIAINTRGDYLGRMVKVKITKVKSNFLIGKIVKFL